MKSYNHYPLHGVNPDRPLNDKHIERFANRVVWPFIDQITGYDFKRRPVGESSSGHVLLDPSESWPRISFRMIVNAARAAKDDIHRLKRGESVSVVKLTTEQVQPKLTRPMHNIYTEAALRGDTGFSEIEPLRDLQAWQIHDYFFKRYYDKFGRRTTWSAQTAMHFELQSRKIEGAFVYGDGHIFASDLNGELDEQVEQLNCQINEYSINIDDIAFLMSAIKRVGYGHDFGGSRGRQ